MLMIRWLFRACPDVHPPTLTLYVPLFLPADADAPLALPAQPEPSSVVLVWTCDHSGRHVAPAKLRAPGLHEDQPGQDGAGESPASTGLGPGRSLIQHRPSSGVGMKMTNILIINAFFRLIAQGDTYSPNSKDVQLTFTVDREE